MRRQWVSLHSPVIGAAGGLIAYGSYGRPLLVFPSEGGGCEDYERHGMVAAVAGLIEAGRLKLYCVDSFDAGSWSGGGSLEERARRHELYEGWIVGQVVPWIHGDCLGPTEIMATGCSLGAYHAANVTLRRADIFPLAICQSGVYDLSRLGGGERGDAFYFANPMDYVANLHGDHLGWLRGHASLLLLCGQGMWEDTTGSLESTRAFAGLLAAKGLRHELDLWGGDWAHDWPAWRVQLRKHLPRFC
jgi:esterase/lipase superfamily enzyme